MKFERTPRVNNGKWKYVLVASEKHRLLFIDKIDHDTIMSDARQHNRHSAPKSIRLVYYFGKK